MLSVVRNAGNGQKYAIFSEGSAAAGWAISLTDGVLVWKGDAVINGDSRPASRSQESSVFYMDKVTSALSSSNLAAGEEERFSFDIIERDPHLSLVVKEKVLGTSTLTVLLKLGLSLFAGDEQDSGGLTPMLLTLQAISSSLNTLISTVRTMEASAESSKMIIDTLCRDMDALTATKDRLQDDMIQKMAVVLGSKKQEIARLRAIVSDYEMHSASSRKLFEDNEAEAKAPKKRKAASAAEGDPKAKKASKTASVDAIKDKVSGKLKGRKKAAVSDQEEDNGSDQQEEEDDLLTSNKVINSIDIKDFLSQTQQLSGHTTQPTVSTLSTSSPDFSYNMNTNSNGHGRSTGTGIRPGSHFGSDSRSTNSKNNHPADSFDFHAYDLPDTTTSSSGYVVPKAAVVSSSSSSGGHHHHQGSKSHTAGTASSLTTNTAASSSSMGSKNSKKAFFEEDSDDETSPVKKKPAPLVAPIQAAGRPPTSKAKAHKAAMDSDDETNNALSYI